MSRSESRKSPGPVLFALGSIGLLLAIARHLNLPVPHVLSEPLLILLFLGATIVGSVLTWRDEHPRHEWVPTEPGQRFHTLVLYTRDDCQLCEEAGALLSRYADWLPDLQLVDIDRDPDLRDRYRNQVPVVELDGEVRFRGKINEFLLRRLIEAAHPVNPPE